MDILFGCPRPDYVCKARVDVKIPSQDGRISQGRPLKVWEGSSDADESLVQAEICENRMLRGLIREKKLAPDGLMTLQAKLSFSDSNQVISKYDVEIDWVAFSSNATHDQSTELIARLVEIYTRSLNEIRTSHEQSISKLSEHYSRTIARMSKSFARGMGKTSEQSATIGQLAQEIQKDREAINAALLRVLSDKTRDSRPAATSALDTAIKGLGLLRDFGQMGERAVPSTPPLADQARPAVEGSITSDSSTKPGSSAGTSAAGAATSGEPGAQEASDPQKRE